MPYEIRLSHVPDGARTEDYLGHDRACATKREAEQVVREFRAAKRARPEDFEPEMDAEIVRL
jgi:hypothetical protein